MSKLRTIRGIRYWNTALDLREISCVQAENDPWDQVESTSTTP